MIESGFLSMEVDVKNQPMDREKLKTFLLETAENRKWLNNPDYEEDGDRFRYVKGEGTAGIEFRKGGTRIKSYHSTDPLNNGHEWSAFNLWVKFNCDENENFIKKLRAAHKYASEGEKGKKYEKLYYYGKL